MISPTFGVRPSFRQCTRPPSSAARKGVSSGQSDATRGVTGTPSSARRIAGFSASARSMVPNFRSSWSQPSMAPGTVMAWIERSAISVRPEAFSQPASAARAERPEALRPETLPSGVPTRAKQSPPTPVMAGSTTQSTAEATTAASAALPPARSVSMAARVARGAEVAAMPRLP